MKVNLQLVLIISILQYCFGESPYDTVCDLNGECSPDTSDWLTCEEEELTSNTNLEDPFAKIPGI